MASFSVTYEVVTPDSAGEGEAAVSGFIVQDVSLRDAVEAFNETRTSQVDGVECVECDEYPIRSPRWVTVFNGREYETGAQESRSLHFPKHLTAASRVRIARLCGASC